MTRNGDDGNDVAGTVEQERAGDGASPVAEPLATILPEPLPEPTPDGPAPQ